MNITSTLKRRVLAVAIAGLSASLVIAATAPKTGPCPLAANYGSTTTSPNEKKVTICHNRQTITIGTSAANAHFAQHAGDTLGPCPP
jgi:hypothetical protein